MSIDSVNNFSFSSNPPNMQFPIIVGPLVDSPLTPSIPKLKDKLNDKYNNLGNLGTAVAISDSELACYYLVGYVLNSHPNLSDEDIQYAANFISSLFAHGQSHLNSSSTILSLEQLLMIIVYLDNVGICKFALTFKEEFDQAVVNREEKSLLMLLFGPKELFIELYDNPYLLDTDQSLILNLIEKEKQSASIVFNLLQNKILNLETIPEPVCLSSSTNDGHMVVENNNEFNWSNLTTKCYDEVCLQESILFKYENPPEYLYTVDLTSVDNQPQPQIYCFHMFELLNSMINPEPINPQTGQKFSPLTLNLINQRLRKEIALYRRYSELIEVNI